MWRRLALPGFLQSVWKKLGLLNGTRLRGPGTEVEALSQGAFRGVSFRGEAWRKPRPLLAGSHPASGAGPLPPPPGPRSLGSALLSRLPSLCLLDAHIPRLMVLRMPLGLGLSALLLGEPSGPARPRPQP